MKYYVKLPLIFKLSVELLPILKYCVSIIMRQMADIHIVG